MQFPQKNTPVIFKNVNNNRLFSIHTIQWLKQNAGYENDRTQTHDHFQIILLTKGTGTFYIDLQKCDFQKNHLFFSKPGQIFSFKSVNELEGYIISFTDSFLGIREKETDAPNNSGLFQMFNHSEGVPISTALAPDVKDFAEKMLKEYNNVHLFREEMLRRYLNILFIYLSRQLEGILKTVPQTRNVELVQKFMFLLDKHFKTEKMVSGYAGLLLITPNHLNEIIKKTTGYSAGYHIRQRIVLEAKRQATYSNICMKQIGYYLGFNDMAHFSKFFKNASGMNFRDFKKEKLTIPWPN